jgi:hypothetical protein
VVLSTWGHIITYDGSRIANAKLVAPGIQSIIPPYSSLFAGYRTRAGTLKAYQDANPGAPTPSG